MTATLSFGWRGTTLAPAGALLAATVIAACGDSATDFRAATDLALQVVSGDSQVGLAFE